MGKNAKYSFSETTERTAHNAKFHCKRKSMEFIFCHIGQEIPSFQNLVLLYDVSYSLSNTVVLYS
jgi:hypothetical protein